MKEIPMLFSTPMVLAELDGRKTMTRRMKGLEQINKAPGKWKVIAVDSPFKPADIFWFEGEGERVAIKCPFGKPSDLLWVRETYRIEGSMSHGESVLGVTYKAGGRWIQNDSKEVFEIFHKSKEGWRPNIFLPKVAARIWLQVTDVRVERLKDITDSDAIAEGIESYVKIADIIAYKNYSEFARKDFLNVSKYGFDNGKETQSAPVASFCTLWMEINGRESWISNPWVWVISFTVLSTTGKQVENSASN